MGPLKYLSFLCGVSESASSLSRHLPGLSSRVTFFTGIGWKLGSTPSVLTSASFAKFPRMSCISAVNFLISSSFSLILAFAATLFTISGVMFIFIC